MLIIIFQVKDFMGSVDDALRWMARYSKDIKSVSSPWSPSQNRPEWIR